MLFFARKSGSSTFSRQVLSRLIPFAILVALTGSAFAQVVNNQSGYASAEAGDWGGANGAILGPTNGTCANMGAVDKENLVSGFGFNIPGGATITDVTAFARTAATKAQIVETQLASNATVVPPTLLGSFQNLSVPATGGGSCATAVDTTVGGPLAGWGNPALTPAIVNNATFGLSMITRVASTVKVDSICLEIRYTTVSGPAVQSQCVTFPPVLTLVKQVTNAPYLGTALPSAWTLTATGPTNLSGVTGTAAVTAVPVTAGVYTLGETGPAGYSGTWNCTGGGTLAQDGVTLTLANANPAQNTTCTITNTALPATLTLAKTLITNNGSNSTLADWTLTATGPSPFTVTGLANSASIVNQLVGAGSYTLNETGPSGFSRSAWSCVDSQSGAVASNPLVLANGSNVTCTITNDDLPSTLKLVKTVTNNNNGTKGVEDWTLTADGTSANDFSGTTSYWAPGISVNADTYVLGESGPAGYTPGAWVCVDTQSGSVASNPLVLGNGRNVTCTINNDDIPATLALSKVVNNSFGGNNPANTFPLTLTGTDGVHNSGVNYFSGGTQPVVVPGVSYTVSETPPSGYQLANPGGIVCTDLDNPQNSPAGTTFTLTEGQRVSCVFTNEDIAPSLTLEKSVNGGSADPSDFTLILNGCNNTDAPYSSGQTATNIESNCAYTLTELPEDGYTSAGVSCVDTGNGNAPVSHPVTLNEGQAVTCTLTNDAVATGTITVIKQVNNNWNGPDEVADFALQITSSGGEGCPGGSGDQVSGYSEDLVAGCEYTVSETQRTGYTQGTITCVNASDNNANLGHPFIAEGGESAVCTIPNDDIPAQLELVKTVSSGDADPAAWLLTATNGSTTEEGQGGFTSTDVAAGNWDLSETGGPTGYTPGDWSCVDAAGADFPLADPDTVTLANGDNVRCTIDNAADATTLTLVKTLTEDNGGNADVDSWTLTADGTTDYSGNTTVYWAGGVTVNADTYTLSESNGPDGYTPGAWVCEDAQTGVVASDPLVLATGQNVTCTIDNDDIAPTLTVFKNVENNSGGNAVVDSFTLTLQGADGGTHDTAQEYSNGQSPEVKANVVYTLDELATVTGYENTGVECLDNSDGDTPLVVTDGSFTLALEQAVTCTLTNDDIAPTLTLFKEVTNDDEGTLGPEAFDLVLTGADVTHDSGVAYKSGESPVILAGVEYEVSEEPETGYRLTGIECELVVDGSENQPLPNPFTPQLEQVISCTVINDDVEPVAVFWVTKDFTDDNTADVQVAISCTTGTYVPETGWIAEGESKGFVVSQYPLGFLSCWVEETSGPDGYITTYSAGADDGVAETISDTEEKPGCYFEQITSGAFTCHIVNTPAAVAVEVTKVWDVTNTGGDYFSRDAEFMIGCNAEIMGSTWVEGDWYYERVSLVESDYSGDQATVTVEVIPNYPSSECFAIEEAIYSAVEVTSDCGSLNDGTMDVSAGNGGSCTITNTVFFEGIPTLNQYGMAIMALLMLGLGAMGIRRFV